MHSLKRKAGANCCWKKSHPPTPLTFSYHLSLYHSCLLFCISMPIPNAHTVCHPPPPPTYNHSLLLTFHTLYTQCDTLCLSPLYNIHIYITFTIIYWHCIYKTIISSLAIYSSTPNPASHHCLQPSLLWASTSCRFLLCLFVGFLLICTSEIYDIKKLSKGGVVWGGWVKKNVKMINNGGNKQEKFCSIITKLEKCTMMTKINIACEKCWPINNNINTF